MSHNCIAPLDMVEQSQMVEAEGDVRMLGPKHFFTSEEFHILFL